MQLVLFIIIVTFTPLSCDTLQTVLEVQSESITDIFEKIDYMSEKCKVSLRDQLVKKCGESPFQTQVCRDGQCIDKMSPAL
uniref:Putative thrombospondin n=1 Tax=Ixodes ricinus TaxID=34613 RepID=A0A090XE36_IXORI